MKAKLNYENFLGSLAAMGLSETQQSKVTELLMQGLDITISEIGEFELEGNSVSIKLLNRRGEVHGEDEPLLLRNYTCDIAGIDCNNIKSITIPKLDCSSTAVLTLDIEYIPFALHPAI